MAKPIFVIGRDRSGTKWLSNIIASQKEVACVQHEEHSGILEASDMLVSMPLLFGNICIPENFIAFLGCLSQTDLFRLTGLDKKEFYKFKPTDYYHLFREMMDRFAFKEGKKYWVQKSDVISLNDLYSHFPDGHFIIIMRNLKDTIRSKIGQRIRERAKDQKKHLLKGSIRHFIDMEKIKKYSNLSNVYMVQYEDLRKNKKPVVKNLCQYLNIKFDDAMLQDRFMKNTSFKNGVSKVKILTKYDLFEIDLISLFLKALPGWMYEYLYVRRKRNCERELYDTQDKRFLSFKLKKKELEWE